MKLRLLRPGAGTILMLISLIGLIVGFVFYFLCYGAFGFAQDRFVIAFTILAFWVILILLSTDYLDPNRPLWIGAIGLVYSFLLLFAFSRILIACISPIGIYFTVNMGDMETYTLGVPRCFVSIGGYLLSALAFVASYFFKGFAHKEVEE